MQLEKNPPLEVGDMQFLLGREVTRTEKGFTIRLNQELIDSVVNLMGVKSGKVMKVPGSTGSRPETDVLELLLKKNTPSTGRWWESCSTSRQSDPTCSTRSRSAAAA